MRRTICSGLLMLLTAAAGVADLRLTGRTYALTSARSAAEIEKCVNDHWTAVGTVSGTDSPGGRTLALSFRHLGPIGGSGPRVVIDLREAGDGSELVIFHPRRFADARSVRTLVDFCTADPPP